MKDGESGVLGIDRSSRVSKRSPNRGLTSMREAAAVVAAEVATASAAWWRRMEPLKMDKWRPVNSHVTRLIFVWIFKCRVISRSRTLFVWADVVPAVRPVPRADIPTGAEAATRGALRKVRVLLQGCAMERALGCVNSTSWLHLAAEGEFTQPRPHSPAHVRTARGWGGTGRRRWASSSPSRRSTRGPRSSSATPNWEWRWSSRTATIRSWSSRLGTLPLSLLTNEVALASS